jgi:hypothetical protein
MTTYLKVLAFDQTNTEQVLFDRCCALTTGCRGAWGDVQLTMDSSMADLFVRLERGADPLATPERTIYVQREPAAKLKQAFRQAHHRIAYFSHYHATMWWVHLTYDELAVMPCPLKPWRLSTVVTAKRSGPGRKARLRYLLQLARQTDLDVFGAFVPLDPPPGLHAVGRIDRKEQGLLAYRFSVAMENASQPNYCSEKLVDPLLCWCRPIYWGAPNIAELLPPGSYIWADPADPDVIDRTLQAMEEPIDYAAIGEARDLILNKYNLMPTLAGFIGGM